MDAVGNGTPKVDLLNMIMFVVPLQTPAQLRTKATLYNRDDKASFHFTKESLWLSWFHGAQYLNLFVFFLSGSFMAVFPTFPNCWGAIREKNVWTRPFSQGSTGVDVDGDVVVARHIVVGVPRMFAFVPVDF